MFKASLAIVAAVLLTAIPALQQGYYVNRWGPPVNLVRAGEQLHEFPRKLGDWQCSEDERPLSEAVCRELGLVEHFHRRYRHEPTGEHVSVLLMVGPPGRLVRHPPDVCYANRANRQVGEPQPLLVAENATDHRFRQLHFERTSAPMLNDFCVAYGFATTDGSWSVPSSPRMAFGGSPGLYKLQVLTEVAKEGDEQRVTEFLQRFVADFPRVLVAPVELGGGVE